MLDQIAGKREEAHRPDKLLNEIAAQTLEFFHHCTKVARCTRARGPPDRTRRSIISTSCTPGFSGCAGRELPEILVPQQRRHAGLQS